MRHKPAPEQMAKLQRARAEWHADPVNALHLAERRKRSRAHKRRDRAIREVLRREST